MPCPGPTTNATARATSGPPSPAGGATTTIQRETSSGRKLCDENSCRSMTLASSGRCASGRTSETERLGQAVARVVRRPSSKYARPNSDGAASTSPYGANAFSVSGSAMIFMRPPCRRPSAQGEGQHCNRGAPRLGRGATHAPGGGARPTGAQRRAGGGRDRGGGGGGRRKKKKKGGGGGEGGRRE